MAFPRRCFTFMLGTGPRPSRWRLFLSGLFLKVMPVAYRRIVLSRRLPALAMLALLAVALASPALAQQPPAVAAAAAPEQGSYAHLHPAFAEFEKAGGFIEYLGREGALETFILVTPEENLKSVYLTPEGNMLMGILVDKQGGNLTAQQLQNYRQRLEGGQAAIPGADKTNVSKAEQVYAAAEGAAWAKVGDDAAPYAYMFVNANCDHCKAMFKDLQPAIKAGRMQLRLIPFGSAPANRDGGAALLSVDDPGAAWLAYINGDTSALAAAKIKPGAVEKVAANTRLVVDRKIKGPPFTLYRKPSDGIITAIIGRPKSTLSLQADLLPMTSGAFDKKTGGEGAP